MKLTDHIQKFQHFINVVEAGSISKGSLKSFITQPQMTKNIKQLEEVTSKKLLVRSREGVKLTPSGLLLYKHAKNVIETTNSLDLELQNQNINQAGHIKIGTYDSIARYFFPDFIKYINKVAPSMKISMTTNKSDQIQKQLQSGELDIAVIVDAKKRKGILIEEIYTDSFLLYSAKMHNMADVPERLIYFNKLENDVREIFSQEPYEEHIKCDNIETIKALTEQGLGHGFLPTKVARNGVLKNKLKMHPLNMEKFDQLDHKINFCMKSSENKKEVLFIKNEISRYLKIWSSS